MSEVKDLNYWYEFTEEQIRESLFNYPIEIALVKAQGGLKELEKHENQAFVQGARKAFTEFLIRHGVKC